MSEDRSRGVLCSGCAGLSGAVDRRQLLTEVVAAFACSDLAAQWAGDPACVTDGADCVPVSQAFTAACAAHGLAAVTVRLDPGRFADHDFHVVSVVDIVAAGDPVLFAFDWTARQFDNCEFGWPFELVAFPLVWRADPDPASTYPLPFTVFAASRVVPSGVSAADVCAGAGLRPWSVDVVRRSGLIGVAGGGRTVRAHDHHRLGGAP